MVFITNFRYVCSDFLVIFESDSFKSKTNINHKIYNIYLELYYIIAHF